MARVGGSTKRLASRFYQLKTGHCLIGQYLNWTKNRPIPQCWWCQYREQTRDHLFKERPEWKPQQKILWAEVFKETKRWKSRWKVRDVLADERCSRPVLDFLTATDVGRRVPAEEDAGSDASEWELRERREREEEREAGTEELGAELGGRGGAPAAPLHTPVHGIGTRRIGDGSRFPYVLPFVLSFVTFLGAHLLFLGTGLGGGQRGACNVPPLRGQRTGKGLYIILP